MREGRDVFAQVRGGEGSFTEVRQSRGKIGFDFWGRHLSLIKPFVFQRSMDSSRPDFTFDGDATTISS